MAIPKPGAPARGLLGRWFRVWGFPPLVGNLCPNFQTSLVIRILPVSFFYGRFVEKKIEFFTEPAKSENQFPKINDLTDSTRLNGRPVATKKKYRLTLLQFQVPVNQAQDVFFFVTY